MQFLKYQPKKCCTRTWISTYKNSKSLLVENKEAKYTLCKTEKKKLGESKNVIYIFIYLVISKITRTQAFLAWYCYVLRLGMSLTAVFAEGFSGVTKLFYK